LFVAAVAAVGVFNASRLAQFARRAAFPKLQQYESIQKGMTEAEVLKRLGKPFRTYDRVTAPADYYIRSYGYERRAITHNVFIYVSSEHVLYVYFDRSNRVEHTSIGGT
jgi:outer membrane protein assembly factor BamE (lipoprotein component of BamABCDE complex)